MAKWKLGRVKCQGDALNESESIECTAKAQIWATFPTGCPGYQWWPLCISCFAKTMEWEIQAQKAKDGSSSGWENETQLVAYIDPDKLPNYGFPQYDEVRRTP